MKYVKKPVEVEARQIPRHEEMLEGEYRQMMEALADWCKGTTTWSRARPIGISIPTLEGTFMAKPGDWIIKGVRGEFYSIKEEIFKETYDPVERS